GGTTTTGRMDRGGGPDRGGADRGGRGSTSVRVEGRDRVESRGYHRGGTVRTRVDVRGGYVPRRNVTRVIVRDRPRHVRRVIVRGRVCTTRVVRVRTAYGPRVRQVRVCRR
ncbi:hypothetical protein, partial [Enterovirga sp.]|uniref:hypothetical protein n=1 Tax=Enterovirga sp. TaxID=2026350 RepID=UPI00262D97A3